MCHVSVHNSLICIYRTISYARCVVHLLRCKDNFRLYKKRGSLVFVYRQMWISCKMKISVMMKYTKHWNKNDNLGSIVGNTVFYEIPHILLKRFTFRGALWYMRLIVGARLWHDDVIKWKNFPRYWPFVRGIHRPPGNSPHKGQWLGALMFSLICAWINGWVNNREAGDLRRYRGHYDFNVMVCDSSEWGWYQGMLIFHLRRNIFVNVTIQTAVEWTIHIVMLLCFKVQFKRI